ncbi:MAG: hypothetical protein WD334_00910 [Chitinophagales bacterium]
MPEILIDSLLSDIDSFETKDRYNIAFVLPFFLDSLKSDSLKKQAHYFFDDASMSLNFYLGATLALDSLKNMGLNADVHVFDSKNNLGQLVQLKKTGALDSMDLIIGPVYNSNVRYMAKWARQNKKIIINPLSPTADLTKDNPWFIQINPSINTHIENLFELLRFKFPKENKILINRPITNELNYRELWEKLAVQHNTIADSIKKAVEFPKFPLDSVKLKHFIITEEDDKMIRKNQLEEDSIFVNLLQEDSLNILILNTIDRAFISKLNRNLYKLSENYEILVVGLPVWNALEDFRLDYVERFQLHYSSDYHIDTNFYKSSVYQFALDSLYINPGAFFIKGFDITMWMGQGLMQYGLDLKTELHKDKLDGFHNKFRLKSNFTDPADTSNRVNYLENSYVHLLYISGYQIKNARKPIKEKE